MYQGNLWELCSWVGQHASHPLPFQRWDFLHLFLLPVKFKAHLLGLQSKMTVTPINIVTAHKQVEWHICTYSARMCAHTYKYTHRDFYVSSLCSCHVAILDIICQYFAWWTHLSGVCSRRMQEYKASLHRCKISPLRGNGMGWKAHVIVRVYVMYMHTSDYFDNLVCLKSSSRVYWNLSTLKLILQSTVWQCIPLYYREER